MLSLHGQNGRFILAALLALPACGDSVLDGADDDAAPGGGGNGDGADEGDDGDGPGPDGDSSTDDEDGGGDSGADPGDGATGDDDGGGGDTSACATVDCSPGYCDESEGVAACECPDGYAAIGLSCAVCEAAGAPADLDVPMVTVDGSVTINLVDPPQSEYDDANLYLRNVGTGDEVLLGNTHDGPFSATVIPGLYDVFYENETGGTAVPKNRSALLQRVDIQTSKNLDLALKAERIHGKITINGGAPPAEVYQNGTLYLRNTVTGDEVRLGDTRNGTYEAFVLPGDYAIYYALKDGGSAVPINTNGFVGSVHVPYLDETDFEHDIDVTAVTVTGTITVSGAAPPASEYDTGRVVLRNQQSGDEVRVGETRDGQFMALVLPGNYTMHYLSVRAGGTVPANEDALIGTMDVPGVIEAPITRDVDVPAVTLEGEITVDGTPPPSSYNDDGRLLARNSLTGDVAVLGNTHDGSFMQVVVPGEYDIYYGQESSSGGVPENTNARLDSVMVENSTIFDVDIPTVPVAGTILLDGQIPPTSQYDDGRLYLRDQVTGDSVLLGNTHDGTFSALVVPGTYDVHYVVETGNGTIPVNNDAFVQTVQVALGTPLNIDIASASLAGNLLVNGAGVGPSPQDRARLYLSDVGTGDEIYLAELSDGTYAQPLVTGRYVLYYRGLASTGVVPANSNAGLRCIDLQ